MFRFKILMMHLTYDQKKDYIDRHGSCCLHKVQLKIMKDQLELEDKGKTGLSLDIGNLKTINILDHVKERDSVVISKKVVKSSSQLTPSSINQKQQQDKELAKMSNNIKTKMVKDQKEERKTEKSGGFLHKVENLFSKSSNEKKTEKSPQD